MDDDPAIDVAALRKAYGDVEAVRGVSLQVRRGEIFAFLGPNGAGKTTTVEILEGFRRRSGGDVRVLGVDPERGDRAWRARIGIVLQEGRAQGELTVRETVELWAAYYPRPRPVDDTIALVGLEDKAGERVARLSGGQRRRLDVGLALAGDPDLVFLDEPTTGAVVLPLYFISGVFVPVDQLPDGLRQVADVLPVKPFVDALYAAFDPRTTGAGLAAADLAILAAWGVVGIVLAVRFFAWTPRR